MPRKQYPTDQIIQKLREAEERSTGLSVRTPSVSKFNDSRILRMVKPMASVWV